MVFTYDQVEIVDAVEVHEYRASSTAAGGGGESHTLRFIRDPLDSPHPTSLLLMGLPPSNSPRVVGWGNIPLGVWVDIIS